MPLSTLSSVRDTIQLKHDAVSLYKGNEVLQQISEASLLSDWKNLYDACPWSTVFQSPEFVTTWYRHYHSVYQPLLIKSVAKGKVVGLLTLAFDERNNIIGAGANQAEYQVWLSAEPNAESFILQALKKLRQHYPNNNISFKYIPEGAPLAWSLDSYWSKYCIRRDARQPLMLIDQAQITQELKKKNRREKLNRLKRLGELKFERLISPDNFSSVLGELIVQSDFRKGAMYNKCAFQEDSLRKGFLIDLFKQELLHATILKVGETIIASNVGFAGKGWLHLQGINTHSPFHARHSPGILHFLMLGNLLAEEEIKVFDLTPGSDPYKETLATDFCTATELSICGQSSWLKNKLKYTTGEYLKNQLLKAGIKKESLRRFKHKTDLLKQKAIILKTKGLPLLLQQHKYRSDANNKYNIYELNGSTFTSSSYPNYIPVSKDSLSDLLLYKATDTLITKWEFLAESMNRFEQGQHCYTWSEHDCLLGWAWESDAKVLKTSGVLTQELPADAVILYGFRTNLPVRKRLQEFILAVATATGKANNNFILLTDDNIKVGFTNLTNSNLTLVGT